MYAVVYKVAVKVTVETRGSAIIRGVVMAVWISILSYYTASL